MSRKQPPVTPPAERSTFYNKDHNAIFKRRFSFNLDDTQEKTTPSTQSNAGKAKIKSYPSK